MVTRVRKIGNSAGVILSKTLLESCGIKEKVNIEVRNSTIVLTPVSQPREGWEAQFLAAQSSEDQEMLGVDVENDFDNSEWTW